MNWLQSQAMILGCIKQGLVSQKEEVIVLSCCGLANTPHFWICASFWNLATSSSQGDLSEVKIWSCQPILENHSVASHCTENKSCPFPSSLQGPSCSFLLQFFPTYHSVCLKCSPSPTSFYGPVDIYSFNVSQITCYFSS